MEHAEGSLERAGAQLSGAARPECRGMDSAIRCLALWRLHSEPRAVAWQQVPQSIFVTVKFFFLLLHHSVGLSLICRKEAVNLGVSFHERSG